MSTQDMDILARKIVSLEKRHNALSRAQQLPNSSVRLVDGDDVSLAESAEATKDIADETAYLGDWLTDADNNLDDNAEYNVEIPEWVQTTGQGVDVAWDSTQFATDLALTLDTELTQAKQELEQAQLDITAATSAANQAASDALQASLDAAAADSKAQSALDTLQNTVTSSVIEYAVGDSDTVAPTTGWSTDNPEPAEGEFVWMRTVVTYVDESTATSLPVLLSRGGSGGGGSTVTIESIQSFYCMVLPPYNFPDLPTTLEPPSPPWSTTPPVYVDEAVLVVADRVLYSNGTFSYMELRLDSAWMTAGAATLQAQDAKYLAEGIYTTIPSVTEPTTRANSSPLVQGDLWYKQGTGSTAGQFTGVAVWDGSQWQDRQLVADSILVPSSVGTTLIADNAITTGKIAAGAVIADKIASNAITSDKIVANAITGDKISATAIDGKTIRGVEIIGGSIVGGSLELADVEGSPYLVFTEECESLTGWFGSSNATLSLTTNSRTGTYAIEVTGTGSPGGSRMVRYFSPTSHLVDTIEMWFWASSATTVNVTEAFLGVWDSIDLPAETWTKMTIQSTASLFSECNIWTSGFTGTLRIDSIHGYMSEEIPESGIRIGRDSNGLATLRSFNSVSNREAVLSYGSLRFGDAIGGTTGVTMDTSGITSTFINEPLQIENQGTGSNADIELIPGSNGKIRLNGNVSLSGTVKTSGGNDYIHTGMNARHVSENWDNGRVYLSTNPIGSAGSAGSSYLALANSSDSISDAFWVNYDGTTQLRARKNGDLRISGKFLSDSDDKAESNITPTSPFAKYSSGSIFQVSRTGGLVTLVGTLTCNTANHLEGTTNRQMGTLPTWARPAYEQVFRMQASSDNSFGLTIQTGGGIQACRYGPGSHGSGVWLPIVAHWRAAN